MCYRVDLMKLAQFVKCPSTVIYLLLSIPSKTTAL